MTTRCSLCGAHRALIRGILACRRCDRADTWPAAAAIAGLIESARLSIRLREQAADLDLTDPAERGDPR